MNFIYNLFSYSTQSASLNNTTIQDIKDSKSEKNDTVDKKLDQLIEPIVIAGFIQEKMNCDEPDKNTAEDQVKQFCISPIDEIIQNMETEDKGEKIGQGMFENLKELELIDSPSLCFVSYICASYMYYQH